MKAKIIGPASELGDIGEGLKFFGGKLTLTREFGDELPDLSKEEVNILKGNRYVVVEGEDESEDTGSADAIKARLTELGVKFDGRSGAAKLQGQLDKAEADQAKADDKAKKAQDDADTAKADAALVSSKPVDPRYPDENGKDAKASAAASSEEA